MNRRVQNILTGFLTACALVLAAPVSGLTSYAASARIAFSDPSATVGQEFNVTVKISSQDGNLGASDVMLSYDPAYIEFVSGSNASGGAGSVRLVGTMDSSATTQFSYTLKFKAVQAGNTTISVGDYEIYDVDTQAVSVTKVGSSAVKVNAPATYSSEAALSSLKVSPGQLSPAFSPDVTSYSVNVGGDVTKLAVSANAKDSKAKVLVNGDSGLQTGANTVVCKVTAEDGQTTKTYTITVNKSESAEVPSEAMPDETAGGETVQAQLGEQTVDVDGVHYQVASSFDASILPEGYTQSACSYGGAEVMCGTGNGLTLIYLQSADGSGSFFIYVPETGALSPYVTIDVTAKSLLVLPLDENVGIPEGFAQTTIQLNGSYKVQGWVWQSDAEQKYCVVYGMNENGEKGLYRFDIAEKTFQRYFEDPAIQSRYDDAAVEALQNEYNSLCRDYNIRFIIIIVLIAVCLILFFIIINLLLQRRNKVEEEFHRREETPTPVKRRAMEEEQRRKSAENRSGSSSAGRTDAAGETGSREVRRNGYREDYAAPAPAGRSGYPENGASVRRQEKRPVDKASARPADKVSVRPADRSSYAAPDRMERARNRYEPERRTGSARSTDLYRADAPMRGTSSVRGTAQARSTSQSFSRSQMPEEPARKRRTPDSYEGTRTRDAGMEEAIRQREMERAERARRTRERLERERMEDERRRARTARMETAASRNQTSEEDDFEFLDLN